MDQVFNEISLSSSLDDKHSALTALRDLGKTTIRLEKLGLTRQIRVTSDFETRYLAPDYTIGNYLHSPLGGQDRTVQSLLRSRFSRAPYVEKLCEELGVTVLDDYCIAGESCKGLALASLWEIPALSLKGDIRFSPPSVTITHDFIKSDNDNLATIQSETYDVGIVCEENDINFHIDCIVDALQSPLCDGAGILINAPDLLPFLRFSSIAKNQLQNINNRNILFPRIRSILIELNRAMKDVKENHQRFSPQGFKFTPTESESAVTGKNGEKHTFVFDRNLFVLCDSHMRITGGDRIYFRGEANEGVVYVGHIGRHLPTKKYC